MMLTKMDIKHIISIADNEQDFLEIFGETEDQIDDWRHKTESQIDDLMIRASKEVSERKTATQSGFKKLAYHHFNGDVLNYHDFKKRWINKDVFERKPAALELVVLMDSASAIAKAKIAEGATMSNA